MELERFHTAEQHRLVTGHRVGAFVEAAPDVASLRIVFVNVHLIGTADGRWTLIDTGVPLSAGRIRRAAELRFGPGARPSAIVLTHGHFDHAGSALALAEHWDVPVYAHTLEQPYLNGHSDYPPIDPTVGGALALMSRTFPNTGYNLGRYLRELPSDGSVPSLPGWRYIHTPGHTAGHISLFRDSDRTLIAGDALATTNQESALNVVGWEPELRRPPAPFTTDWIAAEQSLRLLADLDPRSIAAGHGWPVVGTAVAPMLHRLADASCVPEYGRYVRKPAMVDEHGVIAVPPPVHDPVGQMIASVAAVGAAALLYSLVKPRDRGGSGSTGG